MITAGRRVRAVLLVVIVVALVPACVGPSTQPPTSPTTASPSAALDPLAYASALVEETNAARATEGVVALEASSCAERSAELRAADLVGVPDLAHAPMDDVMRGCDAPRAAENLSRASAGAGDVVDAWLESPGHRNNLLDPDLREVGVACVPDGPALLCSQVFLGR